MISLDREYKVSTDHLICMANTSTLQHITWPREGAIQHRCKHANLLLRPAENIAQQMSALDILTISSWRLYVYTCTSKTPCYWPRILAKSSVTGQQLLSRAARDTVQHSVFVGSWPGAFALWRGCNYRFVFKRIEFHLLGDYSPKLVQHDRQAKPPSCAW
jgi:hypothetical protein